jgi:hypothetical protein
MIFLTAVFILNSRPQFRVGKGNSVFAGEHDKPSYLKVIGIKEAF